MAEKKYIDLTGLTYYDEKIKAAIDSKDAANLKSAKDYADSLAGNYDAAGTAETKVQELANGQVKTNTAAISKLNGDAKTEGSVAKAVADAKAGLETKISAADAKAAGAQTAVDNLKTYVGTIPEGATSKDVVSYVNEKTAGIATDASLSALTKRIGTAEGKITAAEGNITNLSGRADAVEGKVATLVGEDAGKSARTIANEELTKQLIPEGAKESLDTLQEIAAWIQKHPDDASAMNAAISALKTKVGDIPEGATSTTIVAYIKELVDAEKVRATGAEDGIKKDVSALQAAIGEGGSVADQISTAVAAEAALRDAADKTLDGKVATAQAAAETAQNDVDGLKTSKADQTALDTVAGRVTTVEGKVKTLEDASHNHANADVLDAITAGKVAGWDSAHTKEHEHANKTVLDAISETKVSAWDAAEQNAKAYTDGKIAEFKPITNAEIDVLFGVTQA
jgi:hypothetical protein